MQVAPLPSLFSGFLLTLKFLLIIYKSYLLLPVQIVSLHLLLKKGRDWELEAWYSHGRWHRDAGRTADFADGPDF